MKTLPIILSLIFISLGGTCFCQTSATASFTASATIIKPIGITTTSNMNFAGIDAKSGGTITLTPENTRITSGGVALANGSMVSAAAFEVTGEPGFAFSISLPQEDYVLSNGNESMVIKEFTSSSIEGGSLAGGSKTVRVG
ncbi:MAG: DUF4402 domain-containing protein, partial [Salinimicrobium sp.]